MSTSEFRAAQQGDIPRSTCATCGRTVYLATTSEGRKLVVDLEIVQVVAGVGATGAVVRGRQLHSESCIRHQINSARIREDHAREKATSK